MVRIRMNLSQKALSLVLVPLLFSVGTACGVLAILYQTNVEEYRQVKARQITDDLNQCENCILDAGKTIAQMSFDMANRKNFIERFKTDEAEFVRCLADLKDVVETVAPAGHDREQALKAIQKLDDEFGKVTKIVDEGVQLLEDGDRFGAMQTFSQRELKFAFKRFTTEVEDIRTIAHNIVGDEDPNLLIRNRTRLILIVFAGLVANVIVAVVVTVMFNRDIIHRLRALMQNTHRQAAKQELTKPIPGDDEIAQLDQVMYDSALALASVERMKREFMQMISHDLRTPLTSIQLFLNLIGEGVYGQLSDKGAQKARMADINAQRLIKMVSELLDIEKMESGNLDMHMAPCAVRDIAERAMSSVRSFAEEQQVVLESGADELEISADGDRLIQVIVNLLGNAIKFSPAEGVVRLTVESLQDGVIFRISDEGRGVPENMRGAIFERFKQVSKDDAVKLKGTGLGLAISKMIVEQHGGAIGVSDNAPKGSVFWFRLPPSVVLPKERLEAEALPEELSTVSARTAQPPAIES